MPNKGPLAQTAQELAKDLGFRNGSNEREYVSYSSCGRYKFILARSKDIPTYVASGVADLGITGKDVVAEKKAAVCELVDLAFGVCRLVLAQPKKSEKPPKRIATAFPNLTADFLSASGLQAQIVELNGAIESSIAAGVADAIIDLTASGNTLKANDLEVRTTLLDSSAVLIANPASVEAKRGPIEQVVKVIRGDLEVYTGDLDQLSREKKREILTRNRKNNSEACKIVQEIFDNVEKNRDKALQEYSEKFDLATLEPGDFRVSEEEVKQAYFSIRPELLKALQTCAQNIRRFAEKELPTGFEVKMQGGFAGKRVVPLERVGIYAPGGSAAYPSSVLMGVIPAQVAAVQEIILCTPCNSEGKCNPAVLVAADIAGADRIFKLGGAQAIAAMAFGTKTVPKVLKIVGPGNAYVAAAKREAARRGLVSIDSPAGPSEVLIIADESADASFVASEMVAQAEHSPDAACVLISISGSGFIEAVKREIKTQTWLLARRAIVRASFAANGALLTAESIEQALEFVNRYAPEHLVLAIERPRVWLDKVQNAGAVFLGNYSCVAAGDYAVGTNHVLPTAGTAKMYSGLSAKEFVREMNYVKLEKAGLEALEPTITVLAEAEGLAGHALSVKKRFPEGRPE